jgi:hypothetical protein
MKTTYQSIMSEILYKQESKLFDASILLIERSKKIALLEKQRAELPIKYAMKRQEVLFMINEFYNNTDVLMTPKDVIDRYRMLIAQSNTTDDLNNEHNAIGHEIEQLKVSNATRKSGTRPCLAVGCNGVHSTDNVDANGHMICAICGVKACSSCFESVPNNEHKCDPAVLESLQLLDATTRPCPNCNTQITKTEGCSQMFCTACRTPFDWNTLKIIKGRFHNPHTNDATWNPNSMGRDPLDIQCGRDLSNEVIREMQDTMLRLNVDHSVVVDLGAAIVKHLDKSHRDEINKLLRTTYTHDCAKYRLDYLRRNLPDDVYKSILYRLNKAETYRVEKLRMATAYRDTTIDICWPLIDKCKSSIECKYDDEFRSMIKTLHEQLIANAKYFNEEALKIAHAYSLKEIKF